MISSGIIASCGTIIADESRWCRGALALNKFGAPFEPSSRAAVRWSACGVPFYVLKVKVNDFDKPGRNFDHAYQVVALLDLMASRHHQMTIGYANDTLPHEDVVELFRVAYRYAKADEDAEKRKREQQQEQAA
jgi:hypothetical protein